MVHFIINKCQATNMDFVYDRECEFKLLGKHRCRLMLCRLMLFTYMLNGEKELAKIARTPSTSSFTKSTKMIENQLSCAR